MSRAASSGMRPRSFPAAGPPGYGPSMFPPRGNAVCSAACNWGRRKNEMEVGGVMAEPINTHWRVGVSQVFFVHRGRNLIVGKRIKIAADTIIDMTGHV